MGEAATGNKVYNLSSGDTMATPSTRGARSVAAVVACIAPQDNQVLKMA